MADDERSRVRHCRCRRRRQETLRKSAAGIPVRYQHCTIETFAPQNRSLDEALALARRLVEEFPSAEYGLLFSGPCGVGKTHLAVAVLRELVETRGATGLFAEFNDLLRRLLETYGSRSETPSREVLHPILRTNVLLLDDLGSTRMTPWMQDTLSLIINERYNDSSLTLITTNRPQDATATQEALSDRIGERLASRLAEMCRLVPMDGDDFRRHVKAAAFR
ncbi:MAG: ATP-binding protein [Acidobacteriota bacterium]|nr:ATP-binding protein [Acidobacteriota bacterium]